MDLTNLSLARCCLGKRAYRFKQDAKRTAMRPSARHRSKNPRRMTVYRCPECDYWHVGHRRAGERREA